MTVNSDRLRTERWAALVQNVQVASMQIYVVGETGLAIDAVLPVMGQLRTQLTAEQIKSQIARQLNNGYELLAVVDDDKAIATCGFVMTEKLAWGKHIYIDDLVTLSESRSHGAGRLLLDTVVNLARERGCERVELDSGVQRFDAHRFYLRQRFSISSHHFSLSL